MNGFATPPTASAVGAPGPYILTIIALVYRYQSYHGIYRPRASCYSNRFFAGHKYLHLCRQPPPKHRLHTHRPYLTRICSSTTRRPTLSFVLVTPTNFVCSRFLSSMALQFLEKKS